MFSHEVALCVDSTSGGRVRYSGEACADGKIMWTSAYTLDVRSGAEDKTCEWDWTTHAAPDIYGGSCGIAPTVNGGDQLPMTCSEYAAANFVFDATGRTYAESKSYCESLGHTIASIHSAKEQGWVTALISTTAYLGGESDGSGNWQWADGSVWADYRPLSTDGLNGITETKLALENDGEWNDWHTGDALLGVVCRRTAPPMRVCASVNFQPSSSSTPSGYLVDSGGLYATHGDYDYGRYFHLRFRSCPIKAYLYSLAFFLSGVFRRLGL